MENTTNSSAGREIVAGSIGGMLIIITIETSKVLLM